MQNLTTMQSDEIDALFGLKNSSSTSEGKYTTYAYRTVLTRFAHNYSIVQYGVWFLDKRQATQAALSLFREGFNKKQVALQKVSYLDSCEHTGNSTWLLQKVKLFKGS